jgi:hypothetical protein
MFSSTALLEYGYIQNRVGRQEQKEVFMILKSEKVAL